MSASPVITHCKDLKNPNTDNTNNSKTTILTLSNNTSLNGKFFAKKTKHWSWWVFPSFTKNKKYTQFDFDDNSQIYKSIANNQQYLNAYTKVLGYITKEIKKTPVDVGRHIDFPKAMYCYYRIYLQTQHSPTATEFNQQFLEFSKAITNNKNEILSGLQTNSSKYYPQNKEKVDQICNFNTLKQPTSPNTFGLFENILSIQDQIQQLKEKNNQDKQIQQLKQQKETSIISMFDPNGIVNETIAKLQQEIEKYETEHNKTQQLLDKNKTQLSNLNDEKKSDDQLYTILETPKEEEKEEEAKLKKIQEQLKPQQKKFQQKKKAFNLMLGINPSLEADSQSNLEEELEILQKQVDQEEREKKQQIDILNKKNEELSNKLQEQKQQLKSLTAILSEYKNLRTRYFTDINTIIKTDNTIHNLNTKNTLKQQLEHITKTIKERTQQINNLNPPKKNNKYYKQLYDLFRYFTKQQIEILTKLQQNIEQKIQTLETKKDQPITNNPNNIIKTTNQHKTTHKQTIQTNKPKTNTNQHQPTKKTSTLPIIKPTKKTSTLPKKHINPIQPQPTQNNTQTNNTNQQQPLQYFYNPTWYYPQTNYPKTTYYYKQHHPTQTQTNYQTIKPTTTTTNNSVKLYDVLLCILLPVIWWIVVAKKIRNNRANKNLQTTHTTTNKNL